MLKGFDTSKYLAMESAAIAGEIRKYDKVIFEFGGKLFDDYHATRVLPGFEITAKLQLFESFKDEMELIICINSDNIENERIRSDYDTLYVDDCVKLIGKYREVGLTVSGIAFTVFDNQPKAIAFAEKLKKMGENTYFLWKIPNYPDDFDAIMESFKKNDDIITTKPLVIMTSSGSASGKLSACLSQIYKEHKKGKNVGYAKYDIFPVWNLEVNHPLNVAFMAATADSGDQIMVDPFYREKYSIEVSNYNRDIKVFPVIKRILKQITGHDVYTSPTEMVINKMKDSIVDEELVKQKSREEVCRRYLTYQKQYQRGQSTETPILRVEELMKENNITMSDLSIVLRAREIFSQSRDKDYFVLDFNSANDLVIEVDASNSVFETIVTKLMKLCNCKSYETLRTKLEGCNAHMSFIPTIAEEQQIKALGINLTCEPIIK